MSIPQSALLFSLLLLSACNGASIDGMAQEEHRGPIDSMHTSSPAVNAQPLPDFRADTGTSARQTKGTPLDSIKTNANPLYKGDNSDTGADIKK